MANLISCATGSFTTATTWKVCSAVGSAYLDSDAGGTALSTSYQYSSTFVPAATDIDGVAVKVSARAGTTGSIDLILENHTSAGTRVGSQKINVSDVDAGANGWYFFKFGSVVSPNGTDSYKVGLRAEAASQVTFTTNGTAANWCRMVRLITTQAPASGDQLNIMGEWTGLATKTDITVTMDNTATTSFGPTVSGGPPQGMSISKGGTLTNEVKASTNYKLYWKGIFGIYGGGALNIGTVATPLPSTSTATYYMDSASNVDTGLVAYPGGTVTIQGATKTSLSTLLTVSVGGYCTTSGTAVTAVAGNSQPFTGLTGTIVINAVSYTISSVTDATHLILTGTAGTQSTPVKWTHAGTATNITVGSTTDWANGDTLAFASTSRTPGDAESQTIASIGGATTAVLNTALAYTHMGEAPTQCEVVNLTRNILITGASATLQGYVYFQTTSTIDIDYAEFKWLGSATTLKRGLNVTTTTGSFNMQYSSMHDFIVTGSCGLFSSSSTASNITFSNNVLYNIDTNHINIASTTGTITITNNVGIKNTAASTIMCSLSEVDGMTCTGNNFNSSVYIGFQFFQAQATALSINNNTAHSCSQYGFSLSGVGLTGSFTNLTSWRTSGTGLDVTADMGNIYIGSHISFGDTTSNISVNGAVTLDNCIYNADTCFSTTTAITSTSGGNFIALNCNIGSVNGIKTAQTNIVSGASNYFYLGKLINCKLNTSMTFMGTQTGTSEKSEVNYQRVNETNGDHRTYRREGTIFSDTTFGRGDSYSEKLVPNSAYRLRSSEKYVAVGSGNTISISTYTYPSLNYNGSSIRLVLMENRALGIGSNSELSNYTGSVGSWTQLTGITPAAIDDGVFGFYIDCSKGASTGSLWIDDWTAS